jgi:putative heme iron utilization protein
MTRIISGAGVGAGARALIRRSDRATLATALIPEATPETTPEAVAQGWPYASLVMVACGHDASPLLLISDLAEHTKNLATDDRASLLFDGTQGLDNPLTGARVTVVGRIARFDGGGDDGGARQRYIARHPDAAQYAGFGDFGLYRMTVEKAHLVAGFGEIHWIDAEALLFDTADAAEVAAREADIIGHMNADHSDAIGLYATALLERSGAGWEMTGIDPEGVDLRRGAEIARLDFDHPIATAGAAREALVALAERARTADKTLK